MAYLRPTLHSPFYQDTLTDPLLLATEPRPAAPLPCAHIAPGWAQRDAGSLRSLGSTRHRSLASSHGPAGSKVQPSPAPSPGPEVGSTAAGART